MPTLSTAQLSQLGLDDITQASSPLLAEPVRLLESLTGRSQEQKELELLCRLPTKLGFYYLVFRLDARWANGGMQAVALDQDSVFSARLLERTLAAFDFFGATATTALLREIVPVAVLAAQEIDVLVQRDAPDDEFEPVWARLDAYDNRYDDAFSEVYPAILADIHRNPNDW